MSILNKKNDMLAHEILAAISLLDEKGTSSIVTAAMTIVHEAFTLHACKQTIDHNKLFEIANAQL